MTTKPEFDPKKAIPVIVPADLRDGVGSSTAYRITDPNDAAAIWKSLVERALKPHDESIRRINADGSVAVVVFEIDPSCADALRHLGWDGTSPIFRMSNKVRKRFARNLGAQGDAIAQRWLESNRRGRVFLFAELATVLFNRDEHGTYCIEPGSTGTV